MEKILTNVLEIHIIELPKIEKQIKNSNLKNKELLNWVKFFKNPKEMGELDMGDNEALKKAKEEYDEISKDEHEQYLADLRMKYIWDKNSLEEYAIEKGMKKGIEQEKIKIAKEMLKNGADIEFVAKCTKLSKEEIEKLM